MTPSPSLGWLAISCAFLATVILVAFWSSRLGVTRQALTVFALMSLLSITLWQILGFRDDALTYHNAAVLLAETLSDERDVIATLPLGKQSTVWIAGVTYWLVGPTPFPYFLLMAAAVSLIPVILAKTVQIFGFPQATQTVAWVSVFSPPLVAWSPWLTREALAFVLMALCTLVLGLVYTRAHPVWMTTAYAFLATAMYYTRPQLILVLAVGSTVALGLSSIRFRLLGIKRGKSLSQAIPLLLLPVIILVSVLTSLSVAGSTGLLDQGRRAAIVAELAGPTQTLAIPGIVSETEVEPPASADQRGPDQLGTLNEDPQRSAGSDGLVQVTGDENVPVPIDVWHPFSQVLSSMFGPYPWTWQSGPWLIAGLDGLFMLLIWVSVFAGLILVKPMRPMGLVLVAATMPLIAGEAYMHSNYGISMRVRAHYFVLLLPLLGVSLAHIIHGCRKQTGTALRTASRM